jgi:hypothetical protein
MLQPKSEDHEEHKEPQVVLFDLKAFVGNIACCMEINPIQNNT